MIAYIYETKNGGGYGKIVGEMVIQRIYVMNPLELFDENKAYMERCLKLACLTDHNFLEYANGKTCYGWGISSVTRYKEPEECDNPPQSWKYDRDDNVIISISPKWVEKIFNGEKIIEVRKSYPKRWIRKGDK